MKLRLQLIVIVLFSVSAFSQSKEAQLIVEYSNVSCEEHLAYMDMITNYHRIDPTARFYFRAYEGRLGGFLPRVGEAATKLQSIKKWLKSRKIGLDQFVFINGGTKEKFQVQVWQVPAGGLPPLASPTLDKIRHRKGKATGLCLSCEC